MSRPLPTRSSLWQRLLDGLLRASTGPARRPHEPRVEDAQLRPRPDLLQSLGGRVD